MAREDMGRNISPFVVQAAAGQDSRYQLTEDGGFQFFGPGQPLPPSAQEAEGRQFDFPVAYNLNIRPRAYESLSFETLRALADNYDLLRLVIETRKDQVESYEWQIVPKDKHAKGMDSKIQTATEFFLSPDKEHPWNTWLRALLEDLFVLDAVALYPRLTRGDQLYAMELVDGATIKRVLDSTGRTPVPPDPAYQQIIKGLPAVDYTRETLLYTMRNPRTNRVYGYSPVEQIIMTVNIALRRQTHQLMYFTEGNVPEAIAGLPDSWNLEAVKQFQIYWDSLMEGNLSARRHMRFVPFDPSRIQFTKDPELKDLFDEWLARLVCFAFSISPTALVKETNRATSESVAEAAKKEGLVPLLNWLKSLFDHILQYRLGMTALEFKWKVETEISPTDQAQCDKIYLDAKVITPDEVRDRLGMPPLTPEQKEELHPPPPPGLDPAASRLPPGQEGPGKAPNQAGEGLDQPPQGGTPTKTPPAAPKPGKD